MDPLTEAYYKTCQELGLAITDYEKTDAFQVMIGNTPYYFSQGLVPNNDCVGVAIASSKFMTNRILRDAGIPVPNATMIDKKQFKENLWSLGDVQYPVVAKPALGTAGGQDVICNIQSKKMLHEYLTQAFERYPAICIESFQPNLTSYRILMLDSKVIDYYMRIPCHITGDGKSNIKALIEKTSKAILAREIPHRKYPPVINVETDILFKEKGLSFESVPSDGEEVRLRYACNEQIGGYFKRVDDVAIHPDNLEIMIRAAKAVQLNLVGIDLLCEDISKSILKSQGYIIEMNGAPDIRSHEGNRGGKPVPVTSLIIKNQIDKHPWFRFKRHFIKHWEKWALGSTLGMWLLMALIFHFAT